MGDSSRFISSFLTLIFPVGGQSKINHFPTWRAGMKGRGFKNIGAVPNCLQKMIGKMKKLSVD